MIYIFFFPRDDEICWQCRKYHPFYSETKNFNRNISHKTFYICHCLLWCLTVEWVLWCAKLVRITHSLYGILMSYILWCHSNIGLLVCNSGKYSGLCQRLCGIDSYLTRARTSGKHRDRFISFKKRFKTYCGDDTSIIYCFAIPANEKKYWHIRLHLYTCTINWLWKFVPLSNLYFISYWLGAQSSFYLKESH